MVDSESEKAFSRWSCRRKMLKISTWNFLWQTIFIKLSLIACFPTCFVANPFMKKNLLETKSQILRKIVRWRRKAGNRQTSGSTDSSSFTESTTSNRQVPQQMICIDDRYDDTGLATVSDYEEDNEIELDLSDLKMSKQIHRNQDMKMRIATTLCSNLISLIISLTP